MSRNPARRLHSDWRKCASCLISARLSGSSSRQTADCPECKNIFPAGEPASSPCAERCQLVVEPIQPRRAAGGLVLFNRLKLRPEVVQEQRAHDLHDVLLSRIVRAKLPALGWLHDLLK